MPIVSANGHLPPKGNTFSAHSRRAYRSGDVVPVEDPVGRLLGHVECLGEHGEVIVQPLGRKPKDHGQNFYKFRVL